MVSLIKRSEYIQYLELDKYTSSLVDFLLGNKIKIDPGISVSNANDASVCALLAIQENNKKQFVDIYQKISLRKPKPNSDWIFNEILLFSFTLGVYKFKLNHEWLSEVLKLRISHSQDENKFVAQTFSDLLNGNLESTNNFQPLMLVLKYYLDLPIDDEKRINAIYDDLIQKNYPYYKSTFLNIISLRAYDIIILCKGLTDLKRQREIANFLGVFKSRIHQMAFFCWLLLLIFVFGISVWFFFYYIKIGPQRRFYYDKIIAFFPYLSVGGLVGLVFKFRKKIIQVFEKSFFVFFGFKVKQNTGKDHVV